MKTLVLTLALTATAAASAGATTGPAMLTSTSAVGTASNSPSIAQSFGPPLDTFAMGSTLIGGLTFHCTTITMRVTAVTTDAATVDPSWTACTVSSNGTVVGPAQFTTHCDWRLSFANATFTNTSGATTGGTLTTGCATEFSFSGQAGACVLDIPAQAPEGITLQNVDATGSASTSVTPWGVKIKANISGLTYVGTTNTPGTFGGCALLGPGSLIVATDMYLKNAWGRL